MKSIYDMMGKHTYPALREEAPREHVESFFQVPGSGWLGALEWRDLLDQGPISLISKSLSHCPPCSLCLTTFLQKMDRNKDGVVTIEEFIESCQKVWPYSTFPWPQL